MAQQKDGRDRRDQRDQRKPSTFQRLVYQLAVIVCR